MPLAQPNVNVDFIQPGASFTGLGPVAQQLFKNNFNVNSLRTQDILLKDEWKLMDNAVIQIAQKRLIGVRDLIERGLTFNLPNAMGVTKIEWQQAGDLGDAAVSMDAVTEAQRDRLTFALKAMPVPIIHKDFQYSLRLLESSRRQGTPLDVAHAEQAARIVSEKIESILFNGVTVGQVGDLLPGYLTAANRNTGSVTAAWATATGAQIVGDILEMIGVAEGDNMYGPYMLYVPRAVFTHMGDDYKTDSDKTILQRIQEIPGIVGVRPTNDLSGTNILLVQMSSDVVDMIDGIQPTVVMWESHGGFMLNFKVLAIMVPRIKDDKAGQSGIVHYS